MSEKTKQFLSEIFLILGSIIGMGFASGKEVSRFFCYNKTLAFSGVFLFAILFIIFFNLVFNFKKKYNILDLNSFNEKIFKNNSKNIKIILIIIYSISSSCMLAGLDLLINSIFSLNFSTFSLFFSFILFFIIIGGIKRIKIIFSKILPVLLILIFINLFVNSFNFTERFSNFLPFNFDNITFKNLSLSILFPTLFFGSNLIIAINSILASKRKGVGYLSSIIFVVFLLLGSIVVFNTNFSSMPFLDASKNLSTVFYYFYLIAILIALFSSVSISTFNIYSLMNTKTKFSAILIILINQILAFLGFDFIVNYLYTFTGLLGLTYIIFISVKMIMLLRKN